MGRRRRMHDSALGIAEVGGERHDPDGIDKIPGLLLPFTVNDNTPPKAAAAGRRLMPGGRANPRRTPAQPRFAVAASQPAPVHCDCVPPCAAAGFQALQENPGVERLMVGPQVRRKVTTSSIWRAAPTDGRHAAPLAIQVLGGGVDDDIGAQRQRRLQGRCAKTVIHHQQAIVGPCQVSDMAARSATSHSGLEVFPGTTWRCWA